MIINNLQELKQYLPSVNLKVVKSLDDALKLSQDYVTDHIIGTDIESLLESENNPIKSRMKNLVSRAIALEAYRIIIPEVDLQLSEAGFVVQQNEHMTPASRQRVDALINNVQHRRDDAFDDVANALLRESNEGNAYAAWRQSSQYEYLMQAMIPTFSIFTAHITDINNQLNPTSWSKFYDLIPLMFDYFYVVEKFISTEYVAYLRSILPNPSRFYDRNVLRYIRIAMTNIAVNNESQAHNALAKARQYMCENIDQFLNFKNSDVYADYKHDAGKGQIVNFI